MTHDYSDEVFAKRLCSIRRDRDMTQEELADRIGCSRFTVKTWEGGKATPRLDYACAIADVLGCTVEDLVTPFPATRSELEGVA